MLLRRHPNLVHCTFTSIFSYGLTQLPSEALSLESLQFSFSDRGTQAIPQLLDHIVTPSLRELSIETHGGLFPHDSLISMIRRSSCPLVRLSLFNVHITDAQLVECLAILPSLRELELGGMAIGTHTIHKLTLDENDELSSDTLLPNLTSLSLIISGHVLFDFSDLVRMVQSRRRRPVVGGDTGSGIENYPKPVAQMEALTVFGEDCDSYPTPAVDAQFQELEDEGMKVHLELPG